MTSTNRNRNMNDDNHDDDNNNNINKNNNDIILVNNNINNTKNRKRKQEEENNVVDDNNNNNSYYDCPYLDTIQRSLLDFDLERCCQVSLESGPHIYCCLVCGKYYRGRGIHTPAYIHAVEESHYIFVHLQNHTFHCIPDIDHQYKIDINTVQDIKDALYPIYTIQDIYKLDQKSTNTTNNNTNTNMDLEQTQKQQQQQLQVQPAIIARDLFGRKYIPGFIGLSNLHKTDCINAIVQALAHVRPLRDYFLLYHDNNNRNNNKNNININNNNNVIISNKGADMVTNAFSDLIRQLWSSHRFKSHIDPHVLVNAITSASNKKFKVGIQCEAGDLLSWLLHQLHLGTSCYYQTTTTTKTKKNKKKITSIIYETFQGKVRVTTRQTKHSSKKRTHNRTINGDDENENDDDDRIGSDVDELDEDKQNVNYMVKNSNIDNTNQRHDNDDNNNNFKVDNIEETITTTNFLQLTLEIPEKPLFRDEDGGLVIPQEPLVNVLKKVDGVSFSDVVTQNGIRQRKKYELIQLPNYLILHLARFKKNEYNSSSSTVSSSSKRKEKNPSIVVFPVKNLDLTSYVVSDNNNNNNNNDKDGTKKKKDKKAIPTVDEVKNMSVKELKELLAKHGCREMAANIIEKDELLNLTIDFVIRTLPDLVADKYDLVAHVTHESPPDVGREGLIDPLQEGSYKCHVQHRGTNQWYEVQDLHVTEVMPQQIGISESYVLIFERKSAQIQYNLKNKL